MSNSFFNRSGNPQPNSPGSSTLIRSEFQLVEQGFDKLPTLQPADANKVVVVNSTGTALVSTNSLSGTTLSSPTLSNPTVSGGTINGASIGASVAAPITGTTVVATAQFSGPGTGLTGTAAGLSIGGNAATATSALTANTANSANTANTANTATQATNATNVNGGTVNATTGTFSGAVSGASFSGSGTGLTGTANSLSIGGNAATATNAVNAQFAVTQPITDNTNKIATTAFAMQLAFQAALPDVDATTAGQVITNDGTNSFWKKVSSTQVLNYIDQAADITLTTNDGGGLITVVGLNDLTLTLPPANIDNPYFTIKNTGPFSVFIHNAAGQLVQNLQPGTAVVLYASDSTTAAGIWTVSVTTASSLFDLSAASNFVNSTTALISSNKSESAISSTKSVRIYFRNNADLFAVVVTNNSGVLTFGAPALLATDVTAGASFAAVEMLTSQRGVVAYRSGNGSNGLALAFTVSGDTITAGAPVTVVSSATNTHNNICALSSEQALVTYQVGAGNAIHAAVLTVSGTTITKGVTNNNLVTASANTSHGLAALSSSLAAILYRNATDTLAATLTISGTGAAATVTANAAATVQTGTGTGSLAALSSSSLVAVYSQATTANAVANVLTVSGTTITVGAQTTVFTGETANHSVTALSATSAVVVYINNNTAASNQLSISGGTITVGTQVTLNPNKTVTQTSVTALQPPAVAAPNATTALAGYQLNSSVFSQALNISGATVTPQTVFIVLERANSIINSHRRLDSLSATRAVWLSLETASDGRTNVLHAYLVDNLGNRLSKVEVGQASIQAACVSALSSSLAVALFSNASANPAAAALTVTGDTISAGPVVTVNAANSSSSMSISALSSTAAIVHYRNANTSLLANVLTVSGNTVSVGESATVASGVFAFQQVEALSPTTAIAVYTNQSTATSGHVLTISGTTITVGEAQSVGGAGTEQTSALALRKISASQALLYYYTSAGTINSLSVLTQSGTTINSGQRATLIFSASTSSAPSLVATSPSYAYILVANTTSMGSNLYQIPIAGSGVSWGPARTVNVPARSIANSGALIGMQAPLSDPGANRVLAFYNDSDTGGALFYQTRTIRALGAATR